MLSKKRVFRGFRHYFRKMLRKLAVLLRLSSKLQGFRLFNCKRCAKNKIDHFSFKKIRFWAKKLRKNGFFVVFRQYFRKKLPKLAVLIQMSLNLQDSRLLKCRRCASNKMDNFNWKKTKFCAKKRRKNGFFGVFRHYFRKTLPILAVLLPLSSNLQGSLLLKCKRCANNKKEHFTWKKN